MQVNVSCGEPLRRGGAGRGTVTWLGLGDRGSGSVPRQQVHQQLSLPAPHWVGVEAGVGVREDVGEAATRPRYCPVSVPSPGPGHGAHAVLAFTPPQPFSRDKTSSQAGRSFDYRHQLWLMWWQVGTEMMRSCRPARQFSVKSNFIMYLNIICQLKSICPVLFRLCAGQ